MSVDISGFEEAPRATWEQKYMANHYGYRDFNAALTTALPVPPTPAWLTANTYVFGTNARAINARNWPNVGDWDGARGVYARSILVQSDQDAWMVISSINPRWVTDYINLIARRISSANALGQLAAAGILQLITEVPQFIPAGAMMTFRPTLGYSVTVYQNIVPGIIRFWIEGNAEGAE